MNGKRRGRKNSLNSEERGMGETRKGGMKMEEKYTVPNEACIN